MDRTRFFDTHCHYAEAAFDEDIDLCIQRARLAGFAGALVCTCSGLEYEKAGLLAKRLGLSFAAGAFDFSQSPRIDPEKMLAELDAAVVAFAPCAVGEIGIDGKHLKTESESSVRKLFEGALGIALEHNLPVSIHARGAMHVVAPMLKSLACSSLRGVIHAFNGSLEEAALFTRLGFKLGFGSILTNPAAKRTARVFTALERGSWVLETDAPYMAPYSKRHAPTARSEPLDLTDTLKAAAALRGISIECAAQESCRAALEVFPGLEAFEKQLRVQRSDL